MNITYDEILERMSDKFTELSGFEPDSASDIGIRLRVLAGEIFSLNTELAWIKKQMFPNTASGEMLDLHAAQRGLERQRGAKAKGTIAFILDMPVEFDVIVPAGTICTNDEGSLNYITSQEYTIRRGSTVLMAECEAEKSGTIYNTGIGKVKTIVTYFSVGLSISNSTSFTGGTDDEDDESLRKRIFESYRLSPDGVNAAYFESLACSIDGIQSAKAYGVANEPGQIVVVLGGRGAVPESDVFIQASSVLQSAKPVGINMLVVNCGLSSIDVNVSIKAGDGYTFSGIADNVRERIRRFFSELSVGEDVLLSALGKAILEVNGVENYVFTSMSDTAITNADMGKLGTLTVNEMQGG